MKKALTILVLFVLTFSLFALTGCNLFNNGDESELKGVYGVTDFFYRDVNNVIHSFSDKYDYYLLVLNGDGTGKVYIKPINNVEMAYDVTYSPIFSNSEKPKKVTSIKIASFSTPIFSLSGNNAVLDFEPVTGGTSFDFYAMREDLVYRTSSLKKNSAGSIISVVVKLEFNKMYNRVDDKRIQKAKDKQTDEREKRTSTSDED